MSHFRCVATQFLFLLRLRLGEIAAVLLAACLFSAVLLVTAAPAYAHATEEKMTPSADRVVDKAPHQVTIEFSEAVSPLASGTTVLAPDGATALKRPANATGHTLVFPLRANLAEGSYLVSYRVSSADGHPVQASHVFSIGHTSQPPTAAKKTAQPVVDVAVKTNRFIGYIGLALALGSMVVLWPSARWLRDKCFRITATGLSLVAATAIIGLYLHVPYLAGTSLFNISADNVGVVLASNFGGASVFRLLTVVIALAVLKHYTMAKESIASRWGLAIIAVALLATWPMSGHPAASSLPAVTVASDAIHIGAAAIWLGGLATLVLLFGRSSTRDEVVGLLPRWSRLASCLVVLLVVAGLAQAFFVFDDVQSVVTTTYGRLLIAKSVLLVIALFFAYLARKTIRRIMAGDNSAADRGEEVGGSGKRLLRRTIAVELGVSLLIVGLAAVLVHSPPANAARDSQAADATTTGSMESPLYTMKFGLKPGTVGSNTLRVRLHDRDKSALKPLDWRVTYKRNGSQTAALEGELLSESGNRLAVKAELAEPGNWKFVFHIRVSKIDEKTVSTVVTVK